VAYEIIPPGPEKLHKFMARGIGQKIKVNLLIVV
jgi:hypothetical protein